MNYINERHVITWSGECPETCRDYCASYQSRRDGLRNAINAVISLKPHDYRGTIKFIIMNGKRFPLRRYFRTIKCINDALNSGIARFMYSPSRSLNT